MSSSDEDIPIIKRPAFLLAGSKAFKPPVLLDTDDDSPVPSWLAAHKQAAAKRVLSDSSDDEIKQVLSQITSPVKPSPIKKDTTGPAIESTQASHPTSVSKGETRKLDGVSAPTVRQPSSTSSLPLIFPEKLSQVKILLELEHNDEAFGATDLSGDSGAIGRFIVDGNKNVQIDLKGVMYDAIVVPAPVSLAVVNVGPTEAKIECLLSDFIQLREDLRFQSMNGAVFVDEDDERYVVDDEEGKGVENQKKQKVGSKKSQQAEKKPRKAAVKKKAAALRKPRGVTKKSTAPKKQQGKKK